jgi:protoporphyrinogen oxidase
VSAYRLAEAGHEVTVFERDAVPGGLAASFAYDGVPVERYYHFICKPDHAYFRLLDELGMSDALRWRPTRMGYYVDGAYHRFGTPVSLLGFSPLPLASRVRFGLAALRSRTTADWRELDSVSARDWLVAEQDARCYETVWKPLLELKFGDRANDVSAAWMWARINRVANSREGLLMREYLGYLEGGTHTLVDELVRRIELRGGRIRTETAVERIAIDDGRVTGVVAAGTLEPFETVVSTVAAPLLTGLAPDLPAAYRDVLGQVEYYGVACWLLVARAPLSDDFWLNINDPRVPYPGVITYTNLNRRDDLDGRHLLYVPMYMSTNDQRWTADEDVARDELLAALERIRPGFSAGVDAAFLFRDAYAQPVFDRGFGARFAAIAGPETPVAGLFRTDMSQIYPDDRSLLNAIDKGYGLADAVGRFAGE